MGYNNITFERTDPLGLVTIDRPERSNAVDCETGQELVGLAAYRYAEIDDPEISADVADTVGQKYVKFSTTEPGDDDWSTVNVVNGFLTDSMSASTTPTSNRRPDS